MARKAKSKPRGDGSSNREGPTTDFPLRIIGGRFRGTKLRYHGDPRVRPMKHRVREAIFNLISAEVAGRYAIDLFAGTGALGLEALSRGATGATFIERHVPSARIVEENIASLGVREQCVLEVTSAFLWARRDLPAMGERVTVPWLVFCSPPYAFYVDRDAEMLELLRAIQQLAPADSVLVVEADERFNFDLLQGQWKVRTYLPAVVGVQRK